MTLFTLIRTKATGKRKQKPLRFLEHEPDRKQGDPAGLSLFPHGRFGLVW